jgi:hypothetical protein
MKGKINVIISMDVLVDTKDFPECNGISGIVEHAKKALIEDFDEDENIENVECEIKILDITENR